MNDYIYLSDRFGKSLDSTYTNQECKAIRNQKGKCIRGRNANMLVEFNGVKVVVLARRLRKLKKLTT